MKQVKHLLMFLMLLSAISKINAQIVVRNVNEIEKIKSGKTYIVLNNIDTDFCQQYIDIFKKHWTISQVEFIKVDDIEEYFQSGNSFITLEGNRRSMLSTPNGSDYKPVSTLIYWNFWTPEEDFLKKKGKRKFKDNNKKQIARIDLFPDFETWTYAAYLDGFNCNLADHFYNWSPGILKNYLQQLMNYFQNPGKGRSQNFEYKDKDKLQELKNQTLYIPETVRLHYPFTIGTSLLKDQDEKELLKDYEYKYEVISVQELSNKILDESKLLYYLMFIKIDHMKIISIVNSKTGELIYSDFTQMSPNFKSSDMEAISKLIK